MKIIATASRTHQLCSGVITEEAEARLVDNDEGEGILRPWVFEDFSVKPDKAWHAKLFVESLPEGWPAEDEETIGEFAWRAAVGKEVDVCLLRFVDGTFEVSLPEMDEGGLPFYIELVGPPAPRKFLPADRVKVVFLSARPSLKSAIQMDVVSCGGPGGQIETCSSLVFDNRDWFWVHYAVTIADNPDEYGSLVECTEEDYNAGLACGLDWKSQGFDVPQACGGGDPT